LPGEECGNAKNPEKEVVWQCEGGYKTENEKLFYNQRLL
jgi:hypothetical protein